MRAQLNLVVGLALLVLPASAHAQNATGARAFVDGLYQAYQAGDPDYLWNGADGAFSPRLLSLIRKDQADAPEGETGLLDWDPICDCQDSQGLSEVSIAVRETGKGRAQADVRFQIVDEPRVLKLQLVTVQGRWRVDDVVMKDIPSLARLLSRPR